jgi:hypothetical protein
VSGFGLAVALGLVDVAVALARPRGLAVAATVAALAGPRRLALREGAGRNREHERHERDYECLEAKCHYLDPSSRETVVVMA